MSTTLPPQPPASLAQDRARIHNPLAQLRKTINTYVGLEGAAAVALVLAAWFWVGLLVDYGLFRAVLFDWVQATPWGLRAAVLIIVAGALVAVFLGTVLLRLLREFSDATMALVLERRFPKELGDRLITAVEMADPQAAAAQGYSPALVREAIHEAADRVGRLPIGEVFDWRRLIRRGVVVGLLTLGMYLLVAGGFCAARAARGEPAALAGVGDFHEVAGIWAERNILLRNTIWPRRAYLEVLPWPRVGGDSAEGDTGELRIPQGTAPPPLRVRAWKYVVADADAAEGWRLLRWADLSDRPELAGHAEVPPLPATWTPRDPAAGLTVDEVDLYLDTFPLRRGGDGEARWQVASTTDESGWRPLLWSDLTRENLAGLDVPGVPGDWDPKAVPALIASGAGLAHPDRLAAAARLVLGPKYIRLSVDAVEAKLAEAEKRPNPGPAVAAVRRVVDRLNQLATIQDVVGQVGDVASRRAMRRVLRKLTVPETVTLSYSNPRSTNTSSMKRIAGNEFTGSFTELKESVTFTARGEDYVTPARAIVVVERPRLESLESEEERPAYLYYRIPTDGSAADLRGKRQPFEPVRLSVSGEATTGDTPAGTFVSLRGTLTKPLRSIRVEVEPRDQKTYAGGQPEQVDDRSFVLRLPAVRREQRFKLLFEDTDGVVGERKVTINPKEDVTPRVREFAPDDIIRRGRGNEGFVIAAGCRIPFKGRVLDDHGLGRVRYGCRVVPADFLSEQKVRTLFGVAAAPLLAPAPGTTPLLGAGYLTALLRDLAAATADEAGREQFVDLPGFAQAVQANKPGDGRSEIVDRSTLLGLLASRQREPYRKLYREFTLTPDRWLDSFAETDEDQANPSRWVKANDARAPLAGDLPLWQLSWRDRDGRERPIKDPDDTKPQKRFVIEVRLLVEDNYLDGEVDPRTNQPLPHVGPSGETFTFVVVPENELLSRIAEEEEAKYRELQKAFKPLPENLDRLREINFALSGGGSGVDGNLLTNFVARCDSLAEVLKTSHQDVKGVYATYDKILREMRVNQVREDVLTKVYRTIYVPLGQVADRQFDRTHDAVIALRRALDAPGQPIAARVADAGPKAAQARKELNDLVSQLNAILAAMEGLSKINELISELARIEKQEEDLESLVGRIYKKRIEEELKKLD
ncbi:MAG: hypothetical protein U0736_08585 [Gemmataceae bacterium]